MAEREMNPRALGKALGALCNPRRPAAHGRSTPAILPAVPRLACMAPAGAHAAQVNSRCLFGKPLISSQIFSKDEEKF